MLRISGSTMHAFGEQSDESFKNDMTDHYRETFPWHYATWGPEITRTVVDHGWERARMYGFSTRREICLYLTLLPMLGGWFDEDFLLPWAGQILTDSGIREPAIRINRLVAQAMEYLDRVLGPNNRYLHRAMCILRRDLSSTLEKRPQSDLTAHAKSFLKTIFPRKYELHGEDKIKTLIQTGAERAEEYGLVDRQGQLLFIGLMFMLGSHFDRDPQLPSFAPVLRSSISGRYNRLQRVSVELIDHWFAASPELSDDV